MTTPPVSTASQQPPIPLLPDARAAYLNLYNKLQTAIEGSAEPDVLVPLIASEKKISDLPTLDNQARLHQNTAAFALVLKQLNSTNTELKNLQNEIKKITSTISTAADVASAIARALSFF